MDILLLTINPTRALIDLIKTMSLLILPLIIVILFIQHNISIKQIWYTKNKIIWIKNFVEKISWEQKTIFKYFMLWILLCLFSWSITSLIFNLVTNSQIENNTLTISAKQELQEFISDWLISAEKIDWFSSSNNMQNKYVSLRSTLNYWVWLLALWLSLFLQIAWFFFLISCGNKFLRNVWRFFITISILLIFLWYFLSINEYQLTLW